MRMNSLFKAAVFCLGTLAAVSVADAMPALSPLGAPAGVSVGGAQLDNVVVVVTPGIRRRVVVRRPAVVVRRPAVVVRRRGVIRY